jgi:hypothetical protein
MDMNRLAAICVDLVHGELERTYENPPAEERDR